MKSPTIALGIDDVGLSGFYFGRKVNFAAVARQIWHTILKVAREGMNTPVFESGCMRRHTMSMRIK
jgi:hypothetical protein